MNIENNTAWITSCKSQQSLNGEESSGYLVNGNMLVPNDPANRHYQDILDWINAGNTPEPADEVTP